MKGMGKKLSAIGLAVMMGIGLMPLAGYGVDGLVAAQAAEDYPIEIESIQMDRESYVLGETVSITVKLANTDLLGVTDQLYIDFRNEETYYYVGGTSLTLTDDGAYQGEFITGKNWTPGTYRVSYINFKNEQGSGYTDQFTNEPGFFLTKRVLCEDEHAFDIVEILSEGTPLETGQVKYTCSKCGANYTLDYYADKGEASIARCSNYDDAHDIVIPEAIDGNRVVSINDGAFQNNSQLASIQLPAGLTTIGGWAFENCRTLSAIDFPEGLLTIGSSAFEGCSKLEYIRIPVGVTQIGSGTFYGCTNLKEIDIPVNVKNIGSSAFSGCTKLEKIELPDSVTSIYNSAFSGCISLEQIIIPDSVTSIGSGIFSGCSKLKEVKLSDQITDLPFEAFYHCVSLEKISIPDGVTSIGWRAFCGCSSLSEVIIPEGVRYIERSAFRECSNLSEITIPDTVIYINEDAFYDCKNLKSLTVPMSVQNIGDNAFGKYYSNVYGAYRPLDDFTLFCYENSAAEAYAKNNNMKYELLEREGISIEDATVTGVGDMAYRGWERVQYPVVTLDGETLQEGVDYTLSYENNVEIGTATMTVAGIGRYVGAKSVTFKIYDPNLQNIAYSNIVLEFEDGLKYTSDEGWSEYRTIYWIDKEIVPSVKVYKPESDADLLTEGQDYTVEITDNKEPGYAHVKITGTGEYAGSRTVQFYIRKPSITPGNDRFEIHFDQDEFVYDGTAKEPKLESIKDLERDYVLQEGIDYDILGYEYNTDADTNEDYDYEYRSSASVRLKGNYRNWKPWWDDESDAPYTPIYFTINPKSLDDATVTLNHTKFTYDGSAKTPSYTLKTASDPQPVEGEDYYLYYRNNVDVGTATMVIVGYGNFAGLIEKDFTIAEAGSTTGGSGSVSIQPGHTHNWESDYTIDLAPTCSLPGLKSIRCSGCEAVKNTTIIPATGHTYGEWTVTKEATADTDGSRERVCSVCGEKQTEVIPRTAADGTGLGGGQTVGSEQALADTRNELAHAQNELNKTKSELTEVKTLLANLTTKLETLEKKLAKKSANTLRVAVKTKTYKQSALKKTEKSFRIGVSKARGKVTYSLNGKARKAKIKVSKKGKVTIPKKCKKGTYKITVKAAGNSKYKSGKKLVTIRVK